jgi:RecB family exonuclease
MQRRTVIIAGPLAYRMRRAAAARARALGLEILTLPGLAARLAGGFVQPASPDALYGAVRTALADGGFAELDAIRGLPGTARAASRTLNAAWRADLDLATRAAGSPRIADMALLEARVRAALAPAALIAPDLRDAGLRRIGHARALFGTITLEGLLDVDPVWRPLLAALCAQTEVTWQAPPGRSAAWFPGALMERAPSEGPVSAESCADPRAEAVEALRWVRALLASGEVQASEVAIGAVEPEAWDQHLLVLTAEAGLPLHFSHGRPALDTREGQACAALADLLVSGLNQSRVRRWLRQIGRPEGLPSDWARGLRRSAGLFTPEQWRRALAEARPQRTSGAAAEETLLPLLELLEGGPSAAQPAGERLLDGGARALWRRALDSGPLEALPLALGGLRLVDAAPAEACVSWGPAHHLAASPRRYVRLLGLTSRGWPRPSGDDPLLPDHILARRELEPVDRPKQDEDLFRVIRQSSPGALVLSRSRRSSEGGVLPPSRLWPKDALVLTRTRIPDHAFSEADRLLARSQEAVTEPRLASGRLCWRNWGVPALTVHDGEALAQDPVIARRLRGQQSTTSFRRLLRDPLGYVWRYALGWRTPDVGLPPLSLDALAFGELVHELIKLAVGGLEPQPGVAKATSIEIENAVDAAAARISDDWPLARTVPPPLLWRRTVEEAARLALRGLTFVDETPSAAHVWVEVAFGGEGEGLAPWKAGLPVVFGGLPIRGRMDRLDLWLGDAGARVTDYKTGAEPRNGDRIVLAGGGELQRVIYAAVADQLLPNLRRMAARLVYLRGGPSSFELADEALVGARAEAERFVAVAADLLRAGAAPPGPDARDRFNDLRLALPADLDAYLTRKAAAHAASAAALSPLWRRP